MKISTNDNGAPKKDEMQSPRGMETETGRKEAVSIQSGHSDDAEEKALTESGIRRIIKESNKEFRETLKRELLAQATQANTKLLTDIKGKIGELGKQSKNAAEQSDGTVRDLKNYFSSQFSGIKAAIEAIQTSLDRQNDSTDEESEKESVQRMIESANSLTDLSKAFNKVSAAIEQIADNGSNLRKQLDETPGKLESVLQSLSSSSGNLHRFVQDLADPKGILGSFSSQIANLEASVAKALSGLRDTVKNAEASLQANQNVLASLIKRLGDGLDSPRTIRDEVVPKLNLFFNSVVDSVNGLSKHLVDLKERMAFVEDLSEFRAKAELAIQFSESCKQLQSAFDDAIAKASFPHHQPQQKAQAMNTQNIHQSTSTAKEAKTPSEISSITSSLLALSSPERKLAQFVALFPPEGVEKFVLRHLWTDYLQEPAIKSGKETFDPVFRRLVRLHVVSVDEIGEFVLMTTDNRQILQTDMGDALRQEADSLSDYLSAWLGFSPFRQEKLRNIAKTSLLGQSLVEELDRLMAIHDCRLAETKGVSLETAREKVSSYSPDSDAVPLEWAEFLEFGDDRVFANLDSDEVAEKIQTAFSRRHWVYAFQNRSYGPRVKALFDKEIGNWNFFDRLACLRDAAASASDLFADRADWQQEAETIIRRLENKD